MLKQLPPDVLPIIASFMQLETFISFTESSHSIYSVLNRGCDLCIDIIGDSYPSLAWLPHLLVCTKIVFTAVLIDAFLEYMDECDADTTDQQLPLGIQRRPALNSVVVVQFVDIVAPFSEERFLVRFRNLQHIITDCVTSIIPSFRKSCTLEMRSSTVQEASWFFSAGGRGCNCRNLIIKPLGNSCEGLLPLLQSCVNLQELEFNGAQELYLGSIAAIPRLPIDNGDSEVFRCLKLSQSVGIITLVMVEEEEEEEGESGSILQDRFTRLHLYDAAIDFFPMPSIQHTILELTVAARTDILEVWKKQLQVNYTLAFVHLDVIAKPYANVNMLQWWRLVFPKHISAQCLTLGPFGTAFDCTSVRRIRHKLKFVSTVILQNKNLR